MDTYNPKPNKHIIYTHQIPFGKRKKLHETMEQNDGWAYLLSGDTENGELIALISRSSKSDWLLVSDEIPNEIGNMRFGESRHTEISLSNDAFHNLLEILQQASGMKLVHANQKSGRPTKYDIDDAKRVFDMRCSGLAIRNIAKQEHMSPTTVQKLEKQWSEYLLSTGGQKETEQ